MTRIAALQMVSGPEVGPNLATASRLLSEAAAGGAALAVLPEYFCLIGRHDTDKLAAAEAGQLRLDRATVDLEDLVTSVAAAHQARATTAGSICCGSRTPTGRAPPRTR